MAGHRKSFDKITRRTLANYAGMLGRGSIAAQALAEFDRLAKEDRKPVAYMGNACFTVRPTRGDYIAAPKRFG